MRYLRFIFLIIFNLLFASTSFAAAPQSQLTHIIEQIKNLKSAIQQKHSKRDTLQQDLNKIETQFGIASENLQQTNHQILKQKIQISALENNALIYQNQMKIQEQALAEQLRLYYLLRRQGPLKLLLNQQDISQFSRTLYYYQALNLYRIETIKRLHGDLTQIYNRQQQLYAEYQILRKLHDNSSNSNKT